jgi:hypothetical protein
VAKVEASDLEGRGVKADRIKIVYGGVKKESPDESSEDNSQLAFVQFWALPSDAPPPVVDEAKPERTPKEAVQTGSYQTYSLKYPDSEQRIFEGIGDVLRSDKQLSVCFVVWPNTGGEEMELMAGEPKDINVSELVTKWKSELMKKYGIDESRIIIIPAGADELKNGSVDVWVVPPGTPLPDPYVRMENAADTESQPIR